MEQTGGLANLAERLKEKAEQERIRTEKVFIEQLQTLSINLQASSQNALCTMSDAMEREITDATEKLNRHYKLLSLAFARKWISTAILGAFLCLGMMAFGWAKEKIEERNLRRLHAERTQLEEQCQRLREERNILTEATAVLNTTWEKLMDKTSGVAVMEKDGRRFVTAPKGSESGHTINGRPAIKLEE